MMSAYRRGHPLIYVITNLVNGKRYVGMTVQPIERRWTMHKHHAAKGIATNPVACAIRKYGADKFKIEPFAYLLPGLDVEELSLLERTVIWQEQTLVSRGYNRRIGGNEGSILINPKRGHKLSEEHRAKLKAAWTPERKAKFKERMARAPRAVWTPEMRQFYSDLRAERNRVQNQTPEHKAKLKAAWARDPERRVRQAETCSETSKAAWTPEKRAEQAIRFKEQAAEYRQTQAYKDGVAASWTPERRAQRAELTRQQWADKKAANHPQRSIAS